MAKGKLVWHRHKRTEGTAVVCGASVKRARARVDDWSDVSCMNCRRRGWESGELRYGEGSDVTS